MGNKCSREGSPLSVPAGAVLLTVQVPTARLSLFTHTCYPFARKPLGSLGADVRAD